jgi:enterochelin esterase-like enzyme
MTHLPRRLAGALALLLLATVAAMPADAHAARTRAGTLTAATAYSAALGEDISYTAYLPYGYGHGARRYPVLYLLHGRGDTMQAWTQVKDALDNMIQKGVMPPVIAVLPDAPWSQRGSWYVDSRYTGADDPGRPVETALTRDLVHAVDARYRTAPIRQARLVGGYSMGGAGALRFALAHQDLFGSALVLSPAVYTPLPPGDSSTRDYGGFGLGEAKFDDGVYQSLNYPALLPAVDQDLPLHLFIAVGDDEYANPDPADAHHDLDFESEALYNAVRRVPGVSAEMRILDGGHDWSVWLPAFEQGMANLGPLLSTVPPAGLPAPLYGTAGTDWAGGVAGGADGSVTLGYAAGPDAVLTRIGPTGARQWTTQLSTPAADRLYGVAALPDGGAIAAGYTHGDLDGKHPGNAADDAFAVRLSATGAVLWLTQFGVPGVADRAYSLTAAPDGGAYLAGYTKGALDGGNAGDKDAILARIAPDGQLAWVRQFGGAGEDKAFGVAADATGAVVVGGTAGTSGWIARYAVDGTRQWLSTVAGPLYGVAVTRAGLAVATGTGGGDALTVTYTAAGAQQWSSTLGTPAVDTGTAVVALPDGTVEVAGFTRGRVGVPAGGADVLTVHLSATGRQLAAAQFGSARDDGVDPFAEPNLFAGAATGGTVLLSGLTYGSPVGGSAFGNGDVFLATVAPSIGVP